MSVDKPFADVDQSRRSCIRNTTALGAGLAGLIGSLAGEAAPTKPGKPGKAAKRNSYPSGHSTLAFSMGVVLAQLMPAKSQAILARASQFAERRLVCGVHYRSDIVAGQQFGTILAMRLMENPVFQAQMAKAKAELRGART